MISRVRNKLTVQMSLYIIFFFLCTLFFIITGALSFSARDYTVLSRFLFFFSEVFGTVPLTFVMLYFLYTPAVPSAAGASGSGTGASSEGSTSPAPAPYTSTAYTGPDYVPSHAYGTATDFAPTSTNAYPSADFVPASAYGSVNFAPTNPYGTPADYAGSPYASSYTPTGHVLYDGGDSSSSSAGESSKEEAARMEANVPGYNPSAIPAEWE